MATGTINQLEPIKKWTVIINDTTTANSAYDKTFNVSSFTNLREIMFTMQRASNGRTFASSIAPFEQFNSAALYACGNYVLANNQYPIVGVCIHASANQIEIALPAISESIKVRVWVR